MMLGQAALALADAGLIGPDGGPSPSAPRSAAPRESHAPKTEPDMVYRYYIYGIAEDASSEPVTSRPVGADARPVELIKIGGLHVVASAIGDAEILPVRRNTIGHTKVLEELLARRVTVLPMQFGVVIDDLATMNRVVGARESQLSGLIAGLRGKMEVGITVRFDREALIKEIAAERPQVGARGRDLAAKNEVATYHDRVALGQEVERLVRAKNEADRRDMLERIAPFCRDQKEMKVQDDMTVIRTACLIDADAEPALWGVVEAYSRERPARCDISYLAPVPPYNFVRANLDWGRAAEQGR
jgi:hypothetical protein